MRTLLALPAGVAAGRHGQRLRELVHHAEGVLQLPAIGRFRHDDAVERPDGVEIELLGQLGEVLQLPCAVRIHTVEEGAGIPEDLMARLFVPFDRLGADAGREGGAGLGLVLARRLAEAMGGTLELRSAVGAGTHALLMLSAADPGDVPEF